MSGFIGGPGISLPYPANNYGYAPVGGSNRMSLPAGGVFVIPSGRWLISPGQYSFLQFQDFTGLWANRGNPGSHFPQLVDSDGSNYRLANLTGCAIGAVVTNGGSGYTSAPTVTPSAGNSLWTAIVGGAVNATVTVDSGGAGYTYPPIVGFSAPPAGGLPAYGYATLSAGAVTSITMLQQGAGYAAAPTISLIPNPLDPNLGGITNAAAHCVLTGSAGKVTAVVASNHGSPATAVPTLAFAGGGGSAAAATAVFCWSVTGVTVTNAGATVIGTIVGIEFLSAGITATPAFLQPSSYGMQVRKGYATAPISAGAVGTPTILDGGLFPAIPTPVFSQQSGAAPGTAPAITAAVGGQTDTFLMQQAG